MIQSNREKSNIPNEQGQKRLQIRSKMEKKLNFW